MVSEYSRNGDTQSMYEESETDIAEGKEEYVVEKVLDHRVNGNITQFLLKWSGYDSEDNTWEDEENMYVQFVFALKLLKAKAKNPTTKKVCQNLKKQLTNSTKKTTNASQQKTERKRKYMEQDVHDSDYSIDEEYPPPSLTNWEDEVEEVETVERSIKDNGALLIYLNWKNGHRTVHPAAEANLKCPQKSPSLMQKKLSWLWAYYFSLSSLRIRLAAVVIILDNLVLISDLKVD
ncbi:5328_t:CDS:2 [Racocetra persica]|uniref:5328_t:CDS:1 n=1 Tax=Racocetra persica TaxID=160502 RepID=A0ACA9QI21_9GLOM|nr:5328_t:CDS:2 [Racocetra persica]